MEKNIGELVAVKFRTSCKYGYLVGIESDFCLVKLVTQKHDMMIYVPTDHVHATTEEEKMQYTPTNTCDTKFIIYCFAIVTVLGLSVYVSSLYAV